MVLAHSMNAHWADAQQLFAALLVGFKIGLVQSLSPWADPAN